MQLENIKTFCDKLANESPPNHVNSQVPGGVLNPGEARGIRGNRQPGHQPTTPTTGRNDFLCQYFSRAHNFDLSSATLALIVLIMAGAQHLAPAPRPPPTASLRPVGAPCHVLDTQSTVRVAVAVGIRL